ncbi:hypothetical protein C2S51_023529 [Perilla frutescens var. frutescens]|nr:hypothetical protein C2S51_023529 [Perilla frutescens var. frutescens]
MAHQQTDFMMTLIDHVQTGRRPPCHGHGGRHAARNAPPASEDDETILLDNLFADLDPPHADIPRRWETRLRIDIPEFDGSLAVEDFLDWLSSIEEILDYKEVSDDCRVPLVATRLCSHALAWWNTLNSCANDMRSQRCVHGRSLRSTSVQNSFLSIIPVHYINISNCSVKAPALSTRTLKSSTSYWFAMTFMKPQINSSPITLEAFALNPKTHLIF